MEAVQASEEVKEPPPWQRTLYACLCAQLLSVVGFSFVMPFIPFYVRELGVRGEGQVAIWSGLVMMATGVTLTIFSPVWGTLADRYGRKVMVERAMFAASVVLALMGTVRNVYQLVALRFLQGTLTGTGVAATTLVCSVTPRHRLGYSLGLMQVGVVMGASVGPWVGGMIADHWGYRVPFYIGGATLFGAGLVVLLFAYERFERPVKTCATNQGLRQAFGGKGALAMLSVFFLTTFSMTFVGPIFPLFVEKIAVGLKAATVTGTLMGVSGLAAGVSAVVVGRMGDRLGHKRLLVISALLTSVLGILHAVVRTIGQLFGLRIGWGFAVGGTSPAVNALIGTSVSSDTYGRSYGISQSASSLGMAIGPLVGGVAASLLGLRWPFVIMGGLLLLCALLVQKFVHPNGATQSGEDTVTSGPDD